MQDGFHTVSFHPPFLGRRVTPALFEIGGSEALMNYDSLRWQRKRAKILRRDKYMCQLSKRYGKFRQAQVVHHIFPAADYPEYMWEDWNLISITTEMHNKLHDRNTDKLTRMGMDLMKRTARKQGIEI